MPTYKAIVQGGRAVLENLDFEDGTEIEFEVVNDNEIDADERLLNAELDASIENIDAGRTYPAEEVFAELRARR